ncbi:MAG: phosphate signaling complex protein PhoU [Clostridiales bacterium]|nr:phosphate signaling complex protein PhoU [Clostridiales bacterium]
MRNRYHEQLSLLNKRMTEMGALCEQIIGMSARALLDGDVKLAAQTAPIGHEIDSMEREIESICLKLLLQQQPVASDLRQISAALKMITDMERIGDQAEDIADIIQLMNGRPGDICRHFRPMATASAKMVSESVDAYVKQDVSLAQEVIASDDVVDQCFTAVRQEVIEMITSNSGESEFGIDLLMIAKYFERIGDHAENIAEWVVYSVTGVHKEG